METNRITMAWRVLAIFVVVSIAFIGCCSEPDESLPAQDWWMAFIASKTIGAFFAVLAMYLFKKWEIKNVNL